jgi:hypothetical protein
LKYYYTNVESGLRLRRYWTNACPSGPIKSQCTPAKQRGITRWEHEHILEAVQRRLDGRDALLDDDAVSGEMALHVLAYNLTRVMNIVGVQSLLAAIRT